MVKKIQKKFKKIEKRKIKKIRKKENPKNRKKKIQKNPKEKKKGSVLINEKKKNKRICFQ